MEIHLKSKLDPKQLFQTLDTRDPIVLAVSGGGDSMALLLLAAAWSAHSGATLQAVTIDHGLRPEAAAEAAFVAGTCDMLDVAHVTLAWEGLKPSTGLPEASRSARYQLLEEFAVDIGASHILTAHTADDQAETVSMRLSRSGDDSGGFGHAGMASNTTMPKAVTLTRPLLSCRRHELRDYLVENAQSWVEDPSNRDHAYERVRVRHRLDGQESHVSALLDYAALNGRLRALFSRDVAAFLNQHMRYRNGLIASIDRNALLAQPVLVQIHTLRVALAVLGGAEFFASASKIKALLAWITSADEKPKNQQMNMASCILRLTRSQVLVFREQRHLNPLLLGSKDRALWDGRFAITNHTGNSLYVGPAGEAVA